MIFLFITLTYKSFLELYYKCDTGMCVGADIVTVIAIMYSFIYRYLCLIIYVFNVL